MYKIIKQLEKMAEKSNGQMRVVDVPKDRIPNFEQLVKLDNEVLAQVGERNISYKHIIKDDKTASDKPKVLYKK